MNNKTKIIVGAIIVAVVCFYGGYAYGHSSAAAGNKAGAGTFTFSRNGGAGGFAGRMNGSGIAGTVIAKDSQSITVQAPDGSGSKIVFVNSSTQVFKTDQGSLNDIAVGANVVVAGSANSDGSVTAQSVQIRPARMSTSTPASTSTQ